jgi:hypothetical protein
MSSAFDTIDRQKLLENTKNIFGQDEWRMTEKLLSKTTLEVRLLKTNSRPFTTNIGSPQEDALSPILFNIYLECALRELRARLPRPPIDSLLPPEICYADDVDFLSRSKEYTEKVRTNASNSLIVWNLKVNEDKTSSETIKREKEHELETWRKTRKLGSLLGDSEDMAKRQQLAATAFSSLKEMWSRRRIVREWKRLRTYNACVKPVLTYNMSTWGLTQDELEQLDAFHRQQLRSLLGIQYPDTIHNDDLYKRTKSVPISEELRLARWRMLGHVLRMNDNVPAKQATTTSTSQV